MNEINKINIPAITALFLAETTQTKMTTMTMALTTMMAPTTTMTLTLTPAKRAKI